MQTNGTPGLLPVLGETSGKKKPATTRRLGGFSSRAWDKRDEALKEGANIRSLKGLNRIETTALRLLLLSDGLMVPLVNKCAVIYG